MRLMQTFRSLMRAPRFSLSVMLTLGLGLAVTLLMWAVLWHAVLAPLPYRDAAALSVLSAVRDGQISGLSSAEAEQVPALLPPGYSLTSFFWNGTTYTGGERPEAVTTIAVAANFFEVVGIRPLLGRGLIDSDGTSKNVVIAEFVWRKYFNSDPNIIGKDFKEEGGNSVIVGVAPKSLAYPGREVSYFKAIDWAAMRERSAGYLNARFLEGVLRTPTGIDADSAQKALNAAHAKLAEQLGAPVRDWALATDSFEQALRGDVRVPLFALAGLSLLVLLVAATNAAHLVLTRGRQRAAAFAVMDALGASRGELARVVLLETALLATFAAGVAFFMCWAVWKLSPDLSDSGLPIDPELGFGLILNPNLALIALLLSIVSIALAGAYPAWNIAKTGAGSALRAQRSGARAKHWLGIPGTALSLVALFCAGLFLSSSAALRDQRLGLNVDGVVNAQLFMRGESGGNNGPKFAAQAQALLEGAQKIPGAQAVAVSNGVPFTPVFAPSYTLSGGPALLGNAVVQTTVISVLGDPLKTLGYSLRAGRSLNGADSADAARVILVSEGFAKQYFGKADPLGGAVTLPPNGADKPMQFSVVGVFADARRVAPNVEPRPEVWVPFAQYPAHSLAVLVRGAPGGLKAVQEVVWQQDPTQAIFKAYAISEDLAVLTAAPRFFARFAGLFGWLALALAVLGSYAILAFNVTERAREFALRTALGAKPLKLVTALMFESLTALIPGLVLGLCCALALGQLLQSEMYGAPSLMLSAFLATSLVLITSLAASALAARPATKVVLNNALKAI